MSPELRAMMDEQEKYNHRVNLMLEVMRFERPKDLEELILWVREDTDAGQSTAIGCPNLKEGK